METLSTQDTQTLIVILGATTLYVIAHYAITPHGLGKILSKKIHHDNLYILSKMFAGCFFLTSASICLEAIGKDFYKYGLVWTQGQDILRYTLIGFLILFPILLVITRQDKVQSNYPELRKDTYAPRLLCKMAMGWGAYLFGYEYLFRGMLLFYLHEIWGFWPALSISTALYVLAHLHKIASETFSAIPLGIIFAALAIETGSIWVPFFLHVFIAVISENLSLRANPNTSWMHRETKALKS